jgi:hypothetical protein
MVVEFVWLAGFPLFLFGHECLLLSLHHVYVSWIAFLLHYVQSLCPSRFATYKRGAVGFCFIFHLYYFSYVV